MTYRRNRLDDLLHDPMVRLVMAADNIQADELRCLVIRRTCTAAGGASALPAPHVIAACRDALKDCAHR